MRQKNFALAVTIAALMATFAMPASARTIADSTGVNPLHGVQGKDERDRANEGIDQVTGGGGPFCGYATHSIVVTSSMPSTGYGYGWEDYSLCNGVQVRPPKLTTVIGQGWRMVENCPEGYKYTILSDDTNTTGANSRNTVTSRTISATCVRNDF